ncbi:MAG: hypothetical protein GY696_35165 [Gammaproteobacteria bacterium]|nr:hypothetical protein [Gammaproteobacteria bacterium]
MIPTTKSPTTVPATFACLEAKITVKRRIGYHLVQTYIPSGLIVAVSWISFWIDPYAVPARVTLSFTTLLTLTTQAAGVRMNLPHVSYAKVKHKLMTD